MGFPEIHVNKNIPLFVSIQEEDPVASQKKFLSSKTEAVLDNMRTYFNKLQKSYDSNSANITNVYGKANLELRRKLSEFETSLRTALVKFESSTPSNYVTAKAELENEINKMKKIIKN